MAVGTVQYAMHGLLEDFFGDVQTYGLALHSGREASVVVTRKAVGILDLSGRAGQSSKPQNQTCNDEYSNPHKKELFDSPPK
jgi:hypothetical protein